MSGGVATAEAKLHAILPLLRCPECGAPLRLVMDPDDRTERLACSGCGREVPVRNGIPRFVDTPVDDLARRTQASFGYEWTCFDDWKASGSTNFQDYFSGVSLAELRNARVLDAGCGMGRHARQLAAHCERIVAVDFSRAIDAAARNVRELRNVSCVQADLTAVPVLDEGFDFVYSMGVLHHLANTEEAVQALVRKLRRGGMLRLYLYWKRDGWTGWLLKVVSAVRRVTTRLPFPLLRALCWMLSVLLYTFVVLPYRALIALGIRAPEGWPLFVYTKYPFAVLHNDQFDRFSAPLEKRYSEAEARALLESVGLRDVRTRPMFGWLVDGVR
jgi:SAM-dependent methyltransferase